MKTIHILLFFAFMALAMTFSGCFSNKKPSDQVKAVPSPEQAAADARKTEKENLDKQYEELLQKILAKNPEEKKKLEESQQGQPYRLCVGDIIEISVLDEAEMTRELTVIPDGSITYLLVGEVPASGRTIAELREDLTTQLSKYFVNPKVSVILNKAIENPADEQMVSIIGAVKNPGKFKLDNGDRVLDIMAKSGGLLYINDWMGGRSIANLKASYLSRNNRKMDVDFDKLMRVGDMTYNILLEKNDFIYINEAENSSIFVMGEVQNPQIIPFNRDISVVEALSRSGGFTERAEKSRVIVLRNSEVQNEFLYVDVEALMYGSKDEKNVILQANDIVWVPEQGLSEYSRYAVYLMIFADALLKGYEVRSQVMFPKLNRGDMNYSVY